MIFDAGGETGARALERLRTEVIGWLTTVTPEGQPQTFPIWFLWEDGEAVIYSDHRARRNGNVRANPRVSLHLDDDGQGGDVVVLEGEARIDGRARPLTEHAAYLAKYGARIIDSFGSAEAMAAVYNVVIRIRPTRGRAY